MEIEDSLNELSMTNDKIFWGGVGGRAFYLLNK